ncbi:MAG: DNA polymerase III subunit delta' [Parcubacteria group bacterium Licking1014_1]|nr:MAG: DNA polymerase III subunit delta' [Parcubacteria group bacterium Licking1014_1]
MLIGHRKQWDFLKRKFEQNQLSHAYLFAGESQLGKNTFAKEFVKLINCLALRSFSEGGLADKEQACQKCQNCRMIERGNFPDLLTVKSDENEIKINRIREAQNFLSYKSYYGSFKAVIVDDAEKMNQEAQSCFLKTLEEPKGKTIIILISSRSETFLPTITSRCQTVKFFRSQDIILNPDKIEKENKLLKEALKVIGSGLAGKFQYVKSLDLESQGLKEILTTLIKYFRCLLFFKIGAELQKEQKYFIETPADLKNYSTLKIKKIINLMEDLDQQTSSTNASPKLALEILLMEI